MTGFRNKGCEAMTKVVVARISALVPNAQISVYSNDPQYDRSYLDDRDFVSVHPTPRVDVDIAHKVYEMMRKVKRRLTSQQSQHAPAPAEADAVISVGGDVFSSDYGALRRHLSPIQKALKHGTPVAMLAHSIGPFETTADSQLFCEAASRVRLLTVREGKTYDYVNELRISGPRIEQTADPAFLFNGSGVARMAEHYGITGDDRIAGLAISAGIERYAGLERKRHLAGWCRLVDELVSDSWRVMLVPHVRERDWANDDLSPATEVLGAVKHPERVTVLSLHHSAEELKALIGMCRVFVAERMHAAIAALSQAVPCAVVGYSVKAEGILNDIFGDGYADHLLPVEEFCSDRLLALVDYLSQENDKIGALLRTRIPEMRHRAERNFRLLAECVLGR